MDSTGKTNATKNGGSPLNTTTWGGLIGVHLQSKHDKLTTTRLPSGHSLRARARLLTLVGLLMLMAPGAFGQSSNPLSNLAADLLSLPAQTPTTVVVQYYNAPGLVDSLLADSVGAISGGALDLIKGTKYIMTPAAAQLLVTLDSNVKYISPDRPLKGALNFAVSAINADTAHTSGWDGSGIGVAVIDSGVNQVGDLGATGTRGGTRVVYSQNFDPSANTTNDLYGHGTHVAAIIGGNGSNSACSNCDVHFLGVAPNASIINLRALDHDGSATDSTVIAAIQRAIALKNTYNIRVINLSLGRGVFESYTSDPLCQAVEQAWNAGIVVVVAAGNYGRDNSNSNDGYGTITSPGNDPYVITVGAMKTMGTPSRNDDLIATYSSKGPTMLDHVVKPDLVAPGNLIISSLASTSDTLYGLYPNNLVPISYYKTSNDGNASSTYYQLSGTSMAAPMVSGAAALLLQQTPSLTPDQVKARLMLTAYKNFPQSSSYTDPATGITYTDQYDIFTVGAGYLDVAAALANNDPAPATSGSALSPIAAYDSTSGQVYLVNGSSVVWGKSEPYSTSVVWGKSVIWGSNTSGQSVLWGTSVCWGKSTDSGFSVVWGKSVVWGSKTNSDAMTIAIGGDH